MRLTLRTLLAYLDDILEPTEAREIGAKIAESSYASSLVNKIKDVVRRRRISAPEVSGPGSSPDPNIVAEYLDNTLVPDAVADLERVCLESDAHLAEVAACHQVLTLVRSEPVEIPAGMRERMYALGATTPAMHADDLDGASAHVPRVAGVAAADLPRNTQPGAGEVTLEDRLPEALLPRRGSWWRILSYVAGVVILGTWGYQMLNDEALTGFFTDRSRQEESINVDGTDTEVDLTNRQPSDVEGNQRAVVSPADQQASVEPTDNSSIPIEVVTAPDLTMTPPATATDGHPIAASESIPAVPLLPETDATADAPQVAATPADVMPRDDAFDPPVPPPAEQAPLPEPYPVQDTSTSGILLHQNDPNRGWYTLRPRSAIHPQEQVAAPEPFDATFTVGEGGTIAEVILRGGTRLTSLGSTDDGRFGFEIQQGQIIVRRKDTAPADQSIRFRLVARGTTFQIGLLEPGTTLGIEVIPLQPTGEGDLRGASLCDGGIAVVGGAASVSIDGQPPRELRPSAGWLRFSTTADAPLPEPEPLTSVPNWLNLQETTSSAIVRRYAALYEDEFTTDQPISQSIRPVVKDRRPPLSELATQTLALAGSYPGLVDALGAQHEESRLAAIDGLRNWLPLQAQNAQKLEEELHNRFRPEDADTILRLLWGFDEQDARNPLDSEDLFRWMGHEDIAIRELAFYYVHRLTNRRYDYRPNDPAAHRVAALERWREYLGEQGTLISD